MRNFLYSLFLTVAMIVSCQWVDAQSLTLLDENFNGISSGIPTGWSNSQSTSTASYRWQYDPAGYGGSGCMMYNTYSASSGSYSTLMTPVININAPYVLRFKYQNYNAGDLSVRISLDGGNTYSTVIATGLSTNSADEWAEAVFSLTNFIGQTNARIVFYGVSNYGYQRQYIDDVSIETAPTCKAPTGLFITNLSTTSANLNWGLTVDGDNPTYYQLTVTDEHGNVVITNNTIPGTSNNYQLTGLAQNTTYSIRMRSDCSSTLGGNSKFASYSFTTACNPVALPYFENFDDFLGIPDCTYSLNANLDLANKMGTTGKGLKLTTSQSDNAYMILPSVNHAANDLQLTFFAKASTSAPITFMAGIVTDPADIEGTFEPLFIDSISSPEGWKEIRMNTSEASISTSPISMCIFIGGGNSASLYIDNVSITSIPTCVRPEQLRAFSPTYNSINLSWTTVTAPEYLIDVIGAGGDTTVFHGNSNPCTVTGLESNVEYSFRLRAVCSPGDTSEYAPTTVTGKTLCQPSPAALWLEDAEKTSGSDLPDCWIDGYFTRITSGTSYDKPFQTQTSTVHNGSRAFQLRSMSAGNVSFMTSPGFTIDQANAYQATVWIYRPAGTGSVGEGLHFYASNLPDDISAAQDLGFINRCAGNAPVEADGAGWYKYSFPISKTGVVYLIIQGDSKNGSSTYFDDIEVEPAPTCNKPGDIVAGTPSLSDISLSWTPGVNAEQSWVIAYELKAGMISVASDSLVVNTPNYTITGLSASSSYTLKARVYALCTPTDMSEAKRLTHSFSTPCGAITAFPYVQDFDAGVMPPNCWSQQVVATSTSGGSSNAWQASTTYKHSGTHSAYIPDKQAGAKTALTTGELNFTDPNGYQVSFWMYRQSTSYQSKVDEAIHVFVSPSDSLDEATAVELGVVNAHYLNAPAEAALGWYQYTFDVPTSVTGSQYVSFCYHNQYGSGTYIDDVMIRPAPTCRDLNTPSVSDIQPTSATVTLNPVDTAANWDISYGPAGFAAASGTIINVTGGVNNYTITGLTPNQQYDVYVRRNCGTEVGMWTLVPVSFTAVCTSIVPSRIDADAYQITIHAAASAWEVCYGPQGTQAGQGTTIPATDSVLAVTGLTPATDYVFYVRHDCGVVYSDWSSAYNVRTTVVPDSIPFSTGFEDDVDNGLWTIVDGTGSNTFTFGTDTNAVASGSKALYIQNGDAYTYSNSSATKTFAYRTIYFGSGVHNVAFRFKCTGGESSYDFASVMLVPASETLSGGSGSSASSTTWPNFAEVFNPIEGQNYFNLMTGDANGWNNYNADIDMTGREGTYNFVVMWNNDGSVGTANYPISIDNLSISQVSCVVPTVLSGNTTSTGTTITVGTQTASEWEIAVSTTPIDVFGTVTGDVYQQVTNAPAVLTGLTANTAYYYTARAICGVGDTSKWADVKTVRTSCDAYETPYNETFEDAGALNCWSSFGNNEPTRTTSYHFAGTASMKVTDGTAVSPTLNVTTLAQSMLNGWAYSTADSTQFTIGVMVDPEDGGTFIDLGVVMIPAKNTWTEFTSYFNALEDPDYEDFYNAQHFAIAVGGDATIYVDNIYLGVIPTCPKPTETSVTNVLARTFDIAWTENGTATSWRVRAIPAVAGQAVVDTVVTTNPAHISGLNPASNYSIEIQARCSATDSSLVTNCGNIATACDIVSLPYQENFEFMEANTIPNCWDNSASTTSTATGTNTHYVWGVYENGGNKMIRMYNYLVQSGLAVINTPIINLAGSATLYFDYCNQSSSGVMNVEISTNGGSSWTSLGSYASAGSGSYTIPANWISESVTLAPYAGQNAIIRFANQANFGNGAIFVDNIRVIQNRSCADPYDLTTVTPASANDVQISWTPGGTETEWAIRIQDANSTTYQTATTNPYTVTGLNPATNYYISVAAVCAVGDSSYFTNPIAVTTACTAFGVPYIEDFEAMTVNTTPACWDISASTAQCDPGTTNDQANWGVASTNDGKMIRMHDYLLQSDGLSVITSPVVTLPAQGSCIFSFDYSHTGTYCGNLEVSISSDGGANWTMLGTYAKNGDDTDFDASGYGMGVKPDVMQTVQHSLAAYAGQNIKFRFSAMTAYESGAIFVDNVKVVEARNCADIISLFVNPADTFATVTINDTIASHNMWQYICIPAGADTTGIVPQFAFDDEFDVVGLNSSTSYEIYVRAYCDATEQSYWTRKSFKTTLSPAPMPYICQFNDSAENAQWMIYVNSSTTVNHFTIGSAPAALSTGNTSALYVTDGNSYTYSAGNSSSTGAFRLFRFEPALYQISFLWKCTGGEGFYDYARFYLVPASEPIFLPSTGYYSSTGWPATMIALDGGNKQNLVTSPEWNTVDMTVDMTNRAGSYYLAFIWSNDGSAGTTSYPLAINDIEISELSCFAPANVTVDEATVTQTTAVVSYDEMNGTGTSVRYWLNTTGNRSDTLMTGVVTASPFTLSHLSSSTTYYLFMQTECSETDKSSLARTSFSTLCGAVSSFPYTESFEGSQFPPACWSQFSYGSPSHVWSTTSSSSYVHSGSKAASISDISAGAKTVLATGEFNLTSPYGYYLRFWMYRASSTSYATKIDEALHVGYLDEPITAANISLVNEVGVINRSVANAPVEPITSGGYFMYEFEIPAEAAGSTWFSFDFHNQYGGGIYIDDITLEPIPPCVTPKQAPTVDATTMTTLSASASMGGKDTIEFAIAPYSATVTVADKIDSICTDNGRVVFQNLAANTTYVVWYRYHCGDLGISDWSLAYATGTTMTTDCFEPQNLHIVGLVEATTATLTWGSAPDAQSYVYECVGTAISDTVTTDTVVLTNLNPRTNYVFRVKTLCAYDTTAWVSVNFTTPGVPAPLPYVCDFEDQNESNMWELLNGSQANEFIVGNATSNGGASSLYVTNDGFTNAYTGTTSSVTFATRLFLLPVGQYAYSFDWNAVGESDYDYGRAFLVPENATLTPGTLPSAIVSGIGIPSGWIALDANTKLNQASNWQITSGTVSIATAGSYKLVFLWRNDGSVGNNPPLAIDNIQFRALTCPQPTANVIASSIGENTASFKVVNNNDSKTLVYAVSYGLIEDAFVTDTVYGDGIDTITVTGLVSSSAYNFFVKCVCGNDDESFVTAVPFRTSCGLTTLPYSESFETVATSYSGPGMIESICWSDLNASASSSAYPYYKASTSYSTDGLQSLQTYSNTSQDLYLILPTFGDTVMTCRVTFDCSYESLTSSGKFTLGYLTNPAQTSSFVPVYTATANSTFVMASHTADVPNIPAGARIAFKYGNAGSSNYYGWLDNIHVSSIVQGNTYNDNICYDDPYTNYGFNVAAEDIHVGNNVFTRSKAGSAGNPDTLITANVYKRARIQTVLYDTLCQGEQLIWEGHTINNPTTRPYILPALNAACGCDSLVIKFLTVLPTHHDLYDTICRGDYYQFHGQSYNQAGDYTYIGTNVRGCADTTYLHLAVVETTDTVYEAICGGSTFTWHGNSYSTTGIYPWTGQGVHGCPLTEYLNLTVLHSDSNVTVSFCKGGSVLVVDTVISTPGSYELVRHNAAVGCDVTYHITATEDPIRQGNLSVDACEGHRFTGYGIDEVLTKDTVVTQTSLRTADGKCDSMTVVTIKVIPAIWMPVEYVSIDQGQSYTWHGNTYTTPVFVRDTLPSLATGCDSICTLSLTVGGVSPDAVEDVQLLNISVIPNPVNAGQTSFIYGDFENVKSVEVLNSFGQVIDAFVPETYPIEVQGINASGIYYVRVVTEDDKVAVQKLIVK